MRRHKRFSRFGAGGVAALIMALLMSGQPSSAAAEGEPATVQTHAAPPEQFTDTLVASVSSPTAMAFTPDNRLLIATQPGRLRIVKDGALLATTALDLTSRICSGSERGMLGIAANPSPQSKDIYVFYSAKGTNTSCPSGTPAAGAPTNRVSKFVLKDDNTVDPASEVILLDGIYSTAGNHNAGDLFIGKDGYLYVSTGDGGCDYVGGGCAGNNDAARDMNILNGKILRITTGGAAPSDNPYMGSNSASCRLAPAAAGKFCQEAFAVGLRNPFRMAADPNASGTVFRINDVGQNVWEEINQGVKGADYGWNAREGFCVNGGSGGSCGVAAPAQYTDPIFTYGRGAGCTSITGGAYVPNGIWPSAYNGAYLYADYVCNSIFSLSPGGQSSLFSLRSGSGPVDLLFGPYQQGQALYYAGSGQIRAIAYTGAANRAPVAVLTASPATGNAPLTVQLNGSGSSDPDGDALTYLWSYGDGSPDTTSTSPTASHQDAAGSWTASLRVRDASGATSAADTVQVQSGNTAPVAQITSPARSVLFRVGDDYVLTGQAADAQDGALSDTRLSWTIVRKHESHTHPFLGPVTGNNISFEAPMPEDLQAAGNSNLQISLTATDSAGLSSTVTQDFDPKKVSVTLQTQPAGRTITVNGGEVVGPTTVVSWAGNPLQVSVPNQTDGSGKPHVFKSWSDGGSKSHTYVTPDAAATLTATLESYFSDYPPGRPFFADVQWLISEGITQGYADGTFRPASPIDRQALAAFLYRIENPAEPGRCTAAPFPDVRAADRFCGHISWAKTAGVAVGYADGTFRPAALLTRSAMAAFLYRLYNNGEPVGCAVAPFADVRVSDPLCGHIAWLKAEKITDGFPDNTFRPNLPINRDAVAAMLHRAES